MKRRNLCNTKKLMAVILAASMVISSGVTTFAYKEDDNVSINIGAEKISDSDGKVEKELSGNVSDAIDVYSYDNDDGEDKSTEASLKVAGDVIVEDDYHGVQAYSNSSSSSGTSATAEVTITGVVDVESDGYVTGVLAGAAAHGSDSDASVNVHVGGVSSSETSEAGGSSTGIVINAWASDSNSTSSVDVKVDNDVEATSTNGKAYGVKINEVGGNSEIDVNVGGSVKQEGEGSAIYMPDSADDGSVDITIMENVTASDTAVNITHGFGSESEDEVPSVNLTVEGEISGEEHNIVLNEKASLDDVNITTVWKVDTSDDKPVVEAITGYDENTKKPTYGTNDVTKKAEQSINYIISVQSDVSIASGTREVNGYDTAHQDETVTFAVTVPSGYEIENFFNVSPGHIISLNKGSADGTYLLTVPRGGGVDIGVTLKKIQNDVQATTSNQSSAQIQVASTSIDNSKKHESDETTGTTGVQNWSVGNYSDANAAATMQAIQGLQVHALNLGGADMVQNVADVLTPVDTITALNNFSANNVSTMGTNNIMGAGVVDFKSMFLTAATDTVDVPVAASVAEGQSYTVMFSDGTSVVVQCLANGVLNIPFNKNAEGLTYIIYGLQMDPSMFLGMPATSEWTY
ncbi:hypothetical protein [Oribacterium sp. FC2011]|uniref:hypothetical protein n=1 Tax=Oribacterium sp. FC2011 TaxID=1408311 RepID=UPI0004E19A8D|nr:hypothetical protein [Oribacterium sp. FC2011]